MLNQSGLGRRGWHLLGGLASLGCGKVADGDPDPSPSPSGSAAEPESIDEFAQRFASRYCQSIASCCSQQGFATE
jgi:hypothetical protein